jgi:CheY-specific phosphatase CheX
MSPNQIDSVEVIKEIVRNTSLMRMKQHAANEDIRMGPAKKDLPVFGHYMSLIMVAGEALKVTFRTHFSETDARNFAVRIYGKKPAELTHDQMHDYIKEFCNLTAGGIERALEKQGIYTGISLPLVTRGFDELFYPQADGVNSFEDHWTLLAANASLTCSLGLDVYDWNQVKALKAVDTQPEPHGEIEFL